MAERRMFSRRIVTSAKFLKMPTKAQCLYFHLGLQADDDGVVEAFTVMKSIGASDKDLKHLEQKGYVVVLNDDLATYITDWRENNRLRSDRKVDSIYKSLLLETVPDIDYQEKTERADARLRANSEGKKDNGQPMDVQRTTNGQSVDCLVEDSIVEGRIVQDSTVQNSITNILLREELGSAHARVEETQNAFLTLPLKSGSHTFTEEEIRELDKLYNGTVDVRSEIATCIAHCKESKTSVGTDNWQKVITKWIMRSLRFKSEDKEHEKTAPRNSRPAPEEKDIAALEAGF